MSVTGIVPSFGRPGIGTALSAQRLNVSRDGSESFLAGSYVISGTSSRDPGNSASSILSLRPGLLMGKITTGGFYAPSIIGPIGAAYTSGGTSLTVTAAVGAEIVRRFGASGTFTLLGAATAGGTQTSDTVTYSAVSGTTVTVTNIGANRISGSFIMPTDGSQTPLTYLSDGYNIVIPDDSSDVPFPRVIISAVVDVANLINWPTDATLKTFIRTSLSTASGGKFVFNDIFSP